MTGILNLQFVYDLKSNEIAEGILAGVDNGIVLSAGQCIEIGHHAIARGFYYQAIDWMAVAVTKATTKGDSTFVGLKEAQVELETAKKTVRQCFVSCVHLRSKYLTHSSRTRSDTLTYV